MKFSLHILLQGFLLFAGVSAQYVSEGWKPGQAAPRNQEAGHAYDPSTAKNHGDAKPNEETARKASIFDLSSYLESGPIKALFNRAGVNITEKLAAARDLAKIWDERIPLIDDSNYEDVIVEEQFQSLEEERDRVWFIVMYVPPLFYWFVGTKLHVALFLLHSEKVYPDSWTSNSIKPLISRKKLGIFLTSVGVELTI